MTKDQLIFSVMNVIRGQAPTQDSGKFVHPQDISLEIEKAYETVVLNYMNNPEVSKDLELGYFTKTYNLLVKESDGQYYLDLPTTPLPLPGTTGFHLVVPKDGLANFNVISKEQFTGIRHLEALCCSPQPYAYPSIGGKKLYLQGNRPEYALMEEMSVSMVVGFEDYEGEDEIHTPGGTYPITSMILEQLGYRPTDNTNDDGR